jgi:hypothetical protein
MSVPHPQSIRGRLHASNEQWINQCKPGDDVLLMVSASDEIERLTTELALARRRLKDANRGAERLSLRLQVAHHTHFRFPRPRRTHYFVDTITPEAMELFALINSGKLTPAVKQEAMASDAMQAILEGSTPVAAPGTPPEGEKAATAPPAADFLGSPDSIHLTTP